MAQNMDTAKAKTRKVSQKKASNKPKIAGKKAVAKKSARAVARQNAKGPLESIGFAAGKTVGTIAGLADRTTRAIKGAAGKVMRSEKSNK
jgi:hypothetical protein